MGKNVTWKRGNVLYEGCWEEYQVRARVGNRNIGDEKSKFGDGEEYQVVGNYIHPC